MLHRNPRGLGPTPDLGDETVPLITSDGHTLSGAPVQVQRCHRCLGGVASWALSFPTKLRCIPGNQGSKVPNPFSDPWLVLFKK